MMASATPLCGVCQHREVQNAAVVWCNDCDEGLCDTCNGFHAASKGTQHHDTLGIETYLKLPTEIRHLGQKCLKHDIQYNSFCRQHDVPCCKKCMIEDHHTCKEVSDISEVISNVKSSVEFTELEQTVASVLKNIRKLQIKQTDNVKTLEDQKKSIEEEIQRVRVNVNTHLDNIQESLLQELDSLVRSENSNIEASKELLHTYECKMSEFEESLALLKNYASGVQTFLAMKHIEQDVAEITGNNEEVTDDIRILFNKHLTTENFTQVVSSFGTLSIEKNQRCINSPTNQTKQVQVRSVSQNQSIDNIRVSLEQTVNTVGVKVTGCLILPDTRMVFTCYESEKVIVIKPDGSVNFEVETKNGPYDVTYNSNMDHISVSTLSEQIIVISVKERKVIKTINVKEPVGGICLYKSSVVGCTNGGIRMIDLENGSKTTILSTDIQLIDYVDVLNDKVFFTNCYKHTVTCCDIQGNIIWNINDVVECPRGISVDPHGNVFVLSGNNVIVISGNGQNHRELISAEQGLNLPWSIYFDHIRSKILVANPKDGKAFLFNVLPS